MSETLHIVSGDLGGTNMRSAVVALDGNRTQVLEDTYHAISTQGELDFNKVAESGIGETIRNFHGKIVGIALGVAGPIPDHRRLLSASNTACLHDRTPYGIAEDLHCQFGVESYGVNDVEAGCAGEMERGSLQGAKWAMFENIGSGWGGAYVYNGVPVSAEPGHIWLPGSGKRCGCGKLDCAESKVKGMEIENQLRAMHENQQIVIPQEHWNHPCAFSDQEAKRGTPWAVDLYTNIAETIGRIWGSKLNLCPPITDIVYQGSFLECAMCIDFFRRKVRDAMLAQSMFQEMHATVSMRPVAAPKLPGGEPLGPIYGAAHVWRREHNERQPA